jgi:HSP20 family protein
MSNLLRNSRHRYDELSVPFFQEFNRFFDEFFGGKDEILGRYKNSGGYPKLEVSSENGEFKVEAAVPGVSKDQLTVEIIEGVLTISGQVSSNKEEYNPDGSDKQYFVREIVKSRFSRSISLPDGVIGDPTAELKDGVLKLVWKTQEAEKPKPKTISIKG